MADLKISELNNLTGADPILDMLPIVDVSATPPASGSTKRISINNLLSSSPTASGALTITGLVTAGSAAITGAATVGTTLGVTGVSSFAAGTELLPSITRTGDTNTGIYYPAADTFAVTTGGTERIRATSSGLVGISMDPSAAQLQVMNNTDTLSNIAAFSNSSRFRAISLLSGTSTASRNYYFVAGTSSGADPLEIRSSSYTSTDPSAATKIVSLNEAGYLTLSTGDLVMGTSGRGIDFSATAGTGTSELLNDYEEGTWTPVATNLTVVGSVTYTGKYTKIGRVVYINLKVLASTSSSSVANSTEFSGLPFAPADTAPVTAANANTVASLGDGIMDTNSKLYPPTWTSVANAVLSGFYYV